MLSLSDIMENFRFMASEVTVQVEQTLSFVKRPTRGLVEKINSGDDYIDTMKSLIEEKTFDRLMSPRAVDKKQVDLLRSLNTITSNLERIADFAVNIPRQMSHLGNSSFLNRFDFETPFKEVLIGLSKIWPAMKRMDAGLAFRICQCEFNLDAMHKENFSRVLKELRAGGDAGDLVTTLFVSNYLERMGDSLLNIGEAVIFAVVGEKMKIHQYRALTDSLAASGVETPISQVEFESIWGTRSGCRIGTVQPDSQGDAARPVLFKNGSLKKLKAEKENMERWDALCPGLPPKVLAFQEDKEEKGKASVLLEYLSGCTLQELVVNGDKDVLEESLDALKGVLARVWRDTMAHEPVNPGFFGQIEDRQEKVFRIHPQFNSGRLSIGGLELPSFQDLLATVGRSAGELESPFRVLIHGDLNLNNVIYNNSTHKLHFIDLHRTAMADYIQDVSVFMVSNIRLPVFEQDIRDRLNETTVGFYEFARQFALENGDKCFEARLTLGLVRSLFSSTRFEFDVKFAKGMFQRAVYLLEKMGGHLGRPWEEFSLPLQTLEY